MPEYRSHAYKMTLANMRAKRLRDPAFWDYNATLMRDPDFARISRNYAERLRKGCGMADKPPLYFEKRLGGLFPACKAAQDALEAVQGRVKVDIRQTRGNVRRNGLYWACLSIAAPMLSERIEGDALTVDLLHKILKDRAGLVRIVKLPSGQDFKDYDSISFAKMTEPERAEFITWALATLSKWLGVKVEELMREGELAA